MGYRLGLDLGTNSIGWCMLRLDNDNQPDKILGMGVRIFPDGRDAKSQASLAEERRLKRQMRRTRDRYLARRDRFMAALVRHGLMPAMEQERKVLQGLDPYGLRARGLIEPLTLHELGRALFHLNQRRGFRSNRKTDKAEESGKIKPAIQRLRTLMAEAGAATLGAFLDARRKQGLTVRARLQGKKAKAGYDFYPERSLAEEEFDALWSAQAAHHSGLTGAARDELKGILFFQNPLKPVDPGRCTLEIDERRAPNALPTAQRFHIFQELNHLRITPEGRDERPLAFAERALLAEKLLAGKDLSFDAMRKLLKQPGCTFSLEAENRDKIKGDGTAKVLAAKTRMGPRWAMLAEDSREKLVVRLLEEEDEALLVGELVAQWGLDPKTAEQVADAPLPDGYSRLSRKALHAVTRELEKAVIPYSEAVANAGYVSHSHFDTGEIHERLPYYGLALQRHVTFGTGHPAQAAALRYGRITNPTVHIALNQVRRVVNELIKAHGHPSQVVLEVARDLKNGLDAKREIRKRQAQNKLDNDRRRGMLAELGVAETADSMLRLRLWEELSKNPAERRCPYTGDIISHTRLFSADVEVEHILPFARTLDDSPANMTVSLRRANRYKGNMTPFEAFGRSADGYDWQAILDRSTLMPENKRKRFKPDAMERFLERGDFLVRQLTDTQYIARISRQYLCAVCDPHQVWVTPGRLTSFLAKRWLAHGPDEARPDGRYRYLTLTKAGFARKNRSDHRHHAMDALIVAVTDRGLLQRMAALNARQTEQGVDRFLSGLDAPWQGFRDEALASAQAVIVSHRPDHGIGGRLHNETAYGILEDGKGQHRVPILDIDKPADLLKVKGFGLRARLLSAATGLGYAQCRGHVARLASLREKDAVAELLALTGADEKGFAERMAAFAERTGMRRVRLRETVPLVPIRDRQGRAYKGVKTDGNAYYEIRLAPDGTWTGDIVSRLDANRPAFQTRCGALGYPLAARLFINDMLELDHDGRRMLVTVVKLSERDIVMAEHNEADVDRRARNRNNPYNLIRKGSPAALQKAGAVFVFVDPIGRVRHLKGQRHAAAGG